VSGTRRYSGQLRVNGVKELKMYHNFQQLTEINVVKNRITFILGNVIVLGCAVKEVYEKFPHICLLDCDAIWTYRYIPMFRMNILPQSAEFQDLGPEGTDGMFLRNVSTRLPVHTTPHNL
jgi:hypothetical protein